MPITQNIIPTSDGLGQLGTTGQRWSGAWIKGRVNSRGQPVALKYYVSGVAGRYALSSFGADTIPEYGDIIYQISPASLYSVIDTTNLGNESGYQSLNNVLTGLTIIVPSGANNDNYGLFVINNVGVEQWAITPNNLVGFNISGSPSIILSSNGSGYFTSDLTAVNFKGSFSGNGANLTGIVTSGVNSLIISGISVTGNISITGSGASFVSISGRTVSINTPVPGLNYNIILNTNNNLGTNLWFKFDTGIFGFGYSPNPLRGVFDVYKPYSGSSLLSLASSIAVSGSGVGPYNSELVYDIYSFTTISGVNYYSTTYASGSGNVVGGKNAYVSWTSPGAPVSGFLIIGVSGSSVKYTTTNNNFIDSGVSNWSGIGGNNQVYPVFGGPNFYIDNLSNAWLSGGFIYVNGCRVLTLCDTGLFLNTANLTGLLTGYVLTSQTGIFVTTGQTGQFITTGQTGIFITTGQTGMFVTTGQTGNFLTSRGQISGIGRVMVFCAGFTPNTLGGDVAEFPVPYDDDGHTPLNWGIVRVTLRCQQAGGAPSVTLQKYGGSGAFIPTDILTITMPSGGYEAVLHV